MVIEEVSMIIVSTTRNSQNSSFVYLLLYVNNMLIATKNMLDIKNLKDQLSGEFEIKDLGVTKKILEMEI